MKRLQFIGLKTIFKATLISLLVCLVVKPALYYHKRIVPMIIDYKAMMTYRNVMQAGTSYIATAKESCGNYLLKDIFRPGLTQRPQYNKSK